MMIHWFSRSHFLHIEDTTKIEDVFHVAHLESNPRGTDVHIRSPSVNHLGDLSYRSAAVSCLFICWSRRALQVNSRAQDGDELHVERDDDETCEKMRRTETMYVTRKEEREGRTCTARRRHGRRFRVQVDLGWTRSFDIQLIRDRNLDSSECISLWNWSQSESSIPEVNTSQIYVWASEYTCSRFRVANIASDNRPKIWFIAN